MSALKDVTSVIPYPDILLLSKEVVSILIKGQSSKEISPAFNLLKNKSNEQVMRYIKDSLNLKFVLTNQQLTPYNNRFNLILKDYFKLRKKDQLGNELYELL